MIDRYDLLHLKYYEYGKYLTGSYQGMRYRIGRNPLEFVVFKSQEEKESGKLEVCIWPEPYAFEHTPEESKTYESFAFSKVGLEEAWEYLNRIHGEVFK